ncbi:2,3-diaminopropionate biosynthesis protein SbnA [Crateriforma spongiae]|uniref:2,3-diaminopropionate biosynthesis protein SbnA n=1 Tax=Crateriforma spongiae TaxID=2724528 RepID=UPI001447BAAC|nr:2,3-diaminopropionate biosynthesis protein SbnA [Crateriforma spongiae]
MLINPTTLPRFGPWAIPTGRSAVTSVCDGVLDAIGSTPLIRLDRFLPDADIDLLVKVEALNPGGSAKDRPAKRMLQQALDDGRIDQQTVIIESSSGNMGIGLAQACAYHGLRFICVVDPRAQVNNLSIIRALGGEIETVTRPIDGDFLTARLSRVQDLLQRHANAYWPNQYANPANPLAHFHGTIAEIDRALSGEFDVLLVATSSTGTARGCRDFLRQRGRKVDVIAVDSINSVLFGGSPGPRKIPGMGAGKIPALAAGQSFDQVRRVTDLQCVIGCRVAARREAMLVGGSSGGVLATVATMKNELAGKRCVGILHDSGTRYLDTVFNDQWVQSALGIAPERLHQMVTQADFAVSDEVLA